MKRILIIEDDAAIAAIERDYLALSEFDVDIAVTGSEGVAMGRSGRYDLILLDLMLPGIDGFSICRTLRETLDIPILMVTARQEDIDKIKGLGMGADDYITKPFSPNVLVARIKANLAQYDRLKNAGGPARPQIQMGTITLYTDSRRVFVEGGGSGAEKQGIRAFALSDVECGYCFQQGNALRAHLGLRRAGRQRHGGRAHQSSAGKD